MAGNTDFTREKQFKLLSFLVCRGHRNLSPAFSLPPFLFWKLQNNAQKYAGKKAINPNKIG
jgi:hypothetical protein